MTAGRREPGPTAPRRRLWLVIAALALGETALAVFAAQHPDDIIYADCFRSLALMGLLVLLAMPLVLRAFTSRWRDVGMGLLLSAANFVFFIVLLVALHVPSGPSGHGHHHGHASRHSWPDLSHVIPD